LHQTISQSVWSSGTDEVGTETWLDPSIKDAQFFQEGYNIYRNDRNLNGGGVLIAVKDTYITLSVPELQTDMFKILMVFIFDTSCSFFF
jgi:hypothetical protein